MTQNFHNTTGLRGSELRHAERRARTQTWEVEQFFKRGAGRLFTPREVHETLYANRTHRPELTSTRRAITDLTTAGVLMKTETQRRHVRTGAKESCWTYRGAAPVQPTLF